MFEFVGNVVQGGWDALGNIAAGIGQGAGYMASGFFPTQQRTTIQSNLVKPAEGSGWTYRPTPPENQSMLESLAWQAEGWLDSPYEAQYAIPAKVAESKALADSVSAVDQPDRGFTGMLADILEQTKGAVGWAAEQSREIRTMADDIAGLFGKREPISQGPKEIGNSPGVISNVEQIKQAGADVYQTIKAAGAGILDQIKGLFNVGFPQTEAQPAFAIKHSIAPTPKLATGLVIAVGAIIAVMILTRKK